MLHAIIFLQKSYRTSPDCIGYSVFIMNGDTIVEEYSAGAHPLDSQWPGIYHVQTVRKWEIDNAKNMLEEHQGFLATKKQITVEIDVVEVLVK